MNLIKSNICQIKLGLWNRSYDVSITNFKTRNMIHITTKFGNRIMIVMTKLASAASNSCLAYL